MIASARVLAIVLFVLAVTLSKAQGAGGEGQNVLDRIAGEFSVQQLEELSSTPAETEDAARLRALVRDASIADLSLIASTESQHTVVRIYALSDLLFRFFSAWNVDIELIDGLTRIYENRSADWRLRVFAADCLARWFSRASYDPAVRSSGVRFAAGPTAAEVTQELEDAAKRNAAHRKLRDDARNRFVDLLKQEIELLITADALKGEAKTRLNKTMTQARLLGDRRFVAVLSQMAGDSDLPQVAKRGAVEILGEVGDSDGWPALVRFYESNKTGSYYDRRIALTAMFGTDPRGAVTFIRNSLKSSISARERHDLEFKYMDYVSPRRVEGLLGSRYGSMRAAMVRKDWPALNEALKGDNGDVADSFVKFLTRTASLDAGSRKAIAHLVDYLSSSTYAPGSISWTKLQHFASALENYQTLFELSGSALSERRHTFLRLLERRGTRYLHSYLERLAVETLASGRIPEVRPSDLLGHINDPEFGWFLAGVLADSQRFSPSEVIRNLPSNLDRRGASNVVKLLEGQGWESLPEILSALDSRVIAIARADQRGTSVPFPRDRIGPFRQVLSLQVILEQILEGLPESALPLVVDYIASGDFRRPISNVADTLKLTLAQKPVVTLPILTTLLGSDLSVSSRQFLRQVVIDQGPLALKGIMRYLRTETPERLALVSDIASSRAFRNLLTTEQQGAVDAAQADVNLAIVMRKIRAALTRVFVDEIVGLGMLVIVLTTFRRALFARAKALFAELVDVFRIWMIRMIKPSSLGRKAWRSGFIAQSPDYWLALQDHDLCNQQLEKLLAKCANCGSATAQAVATWAIRTGRIAKIAELPEANPALREFIAKILVMAARQEPSSFQRSINEASIAGSIEAVEAKSVLFENYIKPRLSVLETSGLTRERRSALELELQAYSELFEMKDLVPMARA